MTFAARVGDLTAHGGVVTGPGIPNVLIGGQPAAVVGDLHASVELGRYTARDDTLFLKGSAAVLIGGRPALRAGDLSGCGAPIVGGMPTVEIGG